MRMQKKLIASLMAALLTMGTSFTALAAPMVMELGVSEMIDEPEVTLSVSGSTVIVYGAQGETLEIVSITGRSVASIRIDSPAQKVELNLPKGCYILKVKKVVRKVTIR